MKWVRRLNVVKDLTSKSNVREILRDAADDTPVFVILNAVKDLTTKSTAREILRCAQDDGVNALVSFPVSRNLQRIAEWSETERFN